MFGYEADEVVGKPVTMLIPNRYRAAHLKGMERFQSSGEGHAHYKARRENH